MMGRLEIPLPVTIRQFFRSPLPLYGGFRVKDRKWLLLLSSSARGFREASRMWWLW